MEEPSRGHVQPAVVTTEAADKRDVTGRIERARRQLAPAKDERVPSDSRWQNWYSR